MRHLSRVESGILGIIGFSMPCVLPCAAFAGGFEIQQSAYFQGMSFAGVAAGGWSMASISWNPAASAFASNGLTLESSYSAVFPKMDLTVLNPEIQPPPPGTPHVDIGRDALFAASFGAWRLNDRTVLGVSLTSPFGLRTKPDNTNWAGKYVAITSKIFTANATPSLSYEIAPGLAIGAGVQLQYFDVSKLSAATPLGISTIDGDDFGVGFVLGINYSPTPTTSIGLGFRSSIRHELRGDAEIGFNPAAAQLGLVGIARGPIKADLELPEKITFSLRQSLSPSIRMLGTVDWANWSRFDVVPIVLQRSISLGPLPPLQAGSAVASLDFEWRDGWLFALGGEYDWSPNLMLRAGVAYEISPVHSAATRLVQVPDSNRIWASIGASYKLGRNSSIDLAYSHVFFKDDAPFNRSPASTLLQGVPPLLGQADLSADIISVGWRLRWGGSPEPPALLK